MSLSLPGGVLRKRFPYGSPGFVFPGGINWKAQNYTQAAGTPIPVFMQHYRRMRGG